MVTDLNLQIELFTAEYVIVHFGGVWHLKQWYQWSYCFLQSKTFLPGGKKEAPTIQEASKTREAQVTQGIQRMQETEEAKEANIFQAPCQSYKIRNQL